MPVLENPADTGQERAHDSSINRVLVCDDEKNMRRLLSDILTEEGWEVTAVGTAEDALSSLEKQSYLALVLDLSLPGMNGLEMMARLQEKGIEVAVIVITAFATVDVAVKAMKAGAADFIVKPFDNIRLKGALRKVREARDLLDQAGLSQPRFDSDLVGAENNPLDIIGTDRRMGDIFRIIPQIASTRACVLITGESGTGKELVAQAVHFNGVRRDRPFVPINCAALPETLLESEFFGHERGSFTGAYALQKGRFELADGGTLFLDEIGEMPLSLQVKLLRVLQDGRFTRIGGEKEISVDVRIIAATNRDLLEAIRLKTFREDLYYRLNIIPIHLPPLRERNPDIPHLVAFFLSRFSKRHRMPQLEVPDSIMAALKEYHWPGNIRELQNCIEKATVLQDTSALLPVAVPGAPDGGIIRSADATTVLRDNSVTLELGKHDEIRPLGEVAADAQRAAVIRALRICGNNKAEAAKRLDVSYKTLFNKIHDLDIQFQTTIE